MATEHLGFLQRLLTSVFAAMGISLLAASLLSPRELSVFLSGLISETDEWAAHLRVEEQWFLFGSGVFLLILGILIYLLLYIMEYRFAAHRQHMRRGLYATLEQAHLQRLELQYTITLSFLIAFSIARAYVVLLGADSNPDRQLWIGNYHIHHFFFGTALLIFSNWTSLFWKRCGSKTLSAICYGAGMGFFTDEIGLLLTEGDYWTSKTYIFGTLFILILLSLLLHTYIKVHREHLQREQ